MPFAVRAFYQSYVGVEAAARRLPGRGVSRSGMGLGGASVAVRSLLEYLFWCESKSVLPWVATLGPQERQHSNGHRNPAALDVAAWSRHRGGYECS